MVSLFVIVLLLRRRRSFLKQRSEGKERVDEERKTPHNLASLLLTNTTLRTVQQGSTEYDL